MIRWSFRRVAEECLNGKRVPTSRLLNFIDRKRNIVNILPSKIIDSSINKTICINTTKNLLRPIIYSYLLEDCGGFRGFTSLFRGQMLRGRILPFLFNPKSRKENVGRLGGGENIERKREKERGGGRGSEGCQSEKGRTISSSCRHNTGLAPRPLYALQRRTMAGKGVS